MKEKEEVQETILGEYASQIKTMDSQEVEAIIAREIDALAEAGEQLKPGIVLGRLFTKGGAFDDKPVSRKDVAKLVTKALSERD